MKRERLTNEELVKYATEEFPGLKRFFSEFAELNGIDVLAGEAERLYTRLKEYEDLEEQ
jgi:hypothetical protein